MMLISHPYSINDIEIANQQILPLSEVIVVASYENPCIKLIQKSIYKIKTMNN